MASRIISGINLEDFKIRQTVESLARSIYYAVAERWGTDVPIWEAASYAAREHFLGLAEAVLLTEKPDPLPRPIEPVVVVNMSRTFTTGLRAVTHGPLIESIETTREMR